MTTRRTFLKSAMAAAVAGLGQAAAGACDATPLVIIDTHQHLWDLRRLDLPWLKGGGKLNRSYLMADYLRAADELHKPPQGSDMGPASIVKTVYMEVDVAPAQHQKEAEYVLSVCESGKTPMAAAVIGGRPADDDFAKYIQPFKGNRYIKGVRQVLHGDRPAGYCLQKPFIAGIRLLGELGLSFDLCMRSTDLGDAVKLVDDCPDTHFILDHCGNASVQDKERTQWKRDMARLAKRKNVVGKVSGIVATARPGHWTAEDLAPIVNHTLEVFGPDRVMFAGDWPVCTQAATLAQWVNALRSIVHDRKATEQLKLFHDNAVRIYGLKV